MHFWFLVLQKLGKLNYIMAKAYHPITLFNMLEKTFEFILAKKITYLVETYRLLLYNHFGTRWAR